MRSLGGWTEPEASETLVRTWHLEGLSVRPDHRMQGHTGFLVMTRKLADGTVLPARRTRPAKGAYGEDYEAAPMPTAVQAALAAKDESAAVAGRAGDKSDDEGT